MVRNQRNWDRESSINFLEFQPSKLKPFLLSFQVADAVMDEVSDTIHDQKKILKEEMVQVIDKKLDDKIKVQLQEINDLQATINKLKQGNNQVRSSDKNFENF